MGLRSTLAWAAIALAVLLSGCETTTIRSAWFDTEFTGPPMRKIVVLGGGLLYLGFNESFALIVICHDISLLQRA